jgi:hypothetical protein
MSVVVASLDSLSMPTEAVSQKSLEHIHLIACERALSDIVAQMSPSVSYAAFMYLDMAVSIQ